MTRAGIIPTGVFALALGGCYRSVVAPDVTAKANAAFEQTEKNPGQNIASADQKESMVRLWAVFPITSHGFVAKKITRERRA